MRILKMEDNCMIPDGKVVTVEFDDGSVEKFDLYPEEDIREFLNRIEKEHSRRKYE